MEINNAAALSEVTAAFQGYEAALMANDLEALNGYFNDDAATIRYGIGENLYGADAIRSFRAARNPVGLARRTEQTVITTYGDDFATANTLFYRDTVPGKVGRQSQTWVRTADGWKIVSAHVSVIDAV